MGLKTILAAAVLLFSSIGSAETVIPGNYVIAGSEGDTWDYKRPDNNEFSWTLSQVTSGPNAGKSERGNADSGFVYDLTGNVLSIFELDEFPLNPPLVIGEIELGEVVSYGDPLDPTLYLFWKVPSITVPAGTFNDVLAWVFLDGNVGVNTVNAELGLDPLITAAVTDVNYFVPGIGEVEYRGVDAETGNSDGLGHQLVFTTVDKPACEIQLSRAIYVDGDTVTADVLRLANLTANPVATEIKIWLVKPEIPPISVINAGSDGSLIFPAGTDIDLGPIQILSVTAAIPRGSYEYSCRMRDPVTAELLAENRNFFEIRTQVIPFQISDFNPRSAPIGTLITIDLSDFDPSGAPQVTINQQGGGTMAAPVASHDVNTITFTVPPGAASGPLSVTVGGNTVFSSDDFVVIGVPNISSIYPSGGIPGQIIPNFTVQGGSMQGASFTFLPSTAPPEVIASPSTSFDGTASSMSIQVDPASTGTSALVATNSAGSSSSTPAAGNSFVILTLNGDEDNDGQSNEDEVANGTDSFNPDTDGDGLFDNQEIAAGIDPLQATATQATACGDLLSDSIDATGETDFFSFTGNAGDVIDLTLTETSNWGGSFGDIDAQATIFSPTGVQVDQFDSTQQRQITLPETGTYLIRITANNLVSTGSYNLGMSCILPTAPPPTVMAYGDLLSGSIDASGEADFFSFTGNAGDAIDLTLTETSNWGGSFGDIDAQATIFSPTGVQVDQFDSTQQRQITLPETGTYLIRINANNLVSTGSYNLDVDIYDANDDACMPASGWTSFTPTPYDDTSHGLTSLQQPGSRLIYISPAGDDVTAELYFWDGTQIVDSSGSPTASDGTAYGTNPMDPSGPIKPFRRWAYVAPRPNANQDIGTPWDGTGYLAPGEYRASTRYGFPDWWMFQRGEVFDLGQDLLSFAQETNPTVTEVTAGSLAVSGGRSTAERQVVGAYGSLAAPRPRFVNPVGAFISRWSEPDPRHIAYVSLHFDGHTAGGSGMRFRSQGPEAVDILVEDGWFDGAGITVQNTSLQLTFRRTLITDAHSDDHSHVQGLFFSGKRDAQLRFEESILMRNGFSNGDPRDPGNWPPAGDQYFDVFNRNLYISGECDSMASGVFDTLSLLGASGDQFRCGLRLERNFFYQGYVMMGAHGGYPLTDGPSGTMLDNVLLRFKGSGTNDNRGHPGWGFGLTSGAYQVEVARNIVSGAQHPVNHYGLQISPLGWYCYSHVFNHPTQENDIHDNVFDTAGTGGAISILDGVETDKVACSGWTYPGLVGNTVTDNVLINSNGSASAYVPLPPAQGTTHDTAFVDNAIYTTRSEAASSLGWPDPDRTLATYMRSLGYTVTSVDGFDEFFTEATKQRKGNWRSEFTARALGNYMREGFAMPSLGP